MPFVNQLIKESEKIEPVPQVIHELMEMADDPEAPISEITELILYEPVITANLLKLANSAAFGLKKKVESVHDAVVLLGLNQVVEIVLLGSVTKPMKSAHQGYGLEEGRLWKQSVSCALLANAIAEAAQTSEQHIVFTAALLKDIGILVLDKHMDAGRARIQEIMATENLPLLDAERRILEIDHAQLGGQIAANWNFGPTLVDTITHHHLTEPLDPIPEEIAIVYLADCLCSISGINGELFCGPYTHYDQVCQQISLPEERINRIMSDFYSRKDDIYGLLAIL